MRYRLISSVEEIGKETWDSLAAGPENLWGWFRALEDEPLGMKPLHIAVYEKDELIAIMPAFIQAEDLYYGLNKRFYPYIHHLIKYTPFSLEPAIVCNSPGTFTSLLMLREGSDWEKVMGFILDTSDEICRKQEIGYFCIPYLESGKASDKLMRKHGFIGTFYEAGTRLDVTEFRNFREYVAYFRKYKPFSIKKELTDPNRAGITVEFSSIVEGREKELEQLYRNVYHKHIRKRKSFMTESLIRNLGRYLGSQMQNQLTFRNNKLIGFMMSFIHKGQMHLFKAGLDYKMNKKYNLYFNGYHVMASYALEHGIGTIDGGPSTYEAKVRRGYNVYRKNFYIRSPGKIRRAVMKLVLGLNSGRFRKDLAEIEAMSIRHRKRKLK